jgi:hypothetical protein
MRKGTDLGGAASLVGAKVWQQRIERVPAGNMRSKRLEWPMEPNIRRKYSSLFAVIGRPVEEGIHRARD